MNYIFRFLLAACIISTCPNLCADAIDDALATYEVELTATDTAVGNLFYTFGSVRANTATSLISGINDIQSDITDSLDGASPSQTTTLNALHTSFETYKSLCVDCQTLGNLHQDVADALSDLSTIDISRTATANGIIISSALSDLATTVTSFTNLRTLGKNGGEGSIVNDIAWTEFLIEQDRATTAHTAAADLNEFAIGNLAVASALADVPSPSDDSIIDYDTSYVEAQNAVQNNATSTRALLVTASTPVDTLASSNRASSADQLDFIADAALALQDQVAQFNANLTATIKQATQGISDVALRIVQQELLFDAITYIQKQNLIRSIIININGNSSAAQDLQSAVSTVTSLLTVTPPTFSSDPLPVAPEGHPSAMQQQVDTQADAYLSLLEATIRQLFTSPPSQETLDIVVANLSPAVYLQMTSSVMSTWLTARAGDIAAFSPFSDAPISDYSNEWTQLIAVLDASKANSLISSSARTAITTAEADANFAHLFTGITSAADFALKVTALNKRPLGPVRAIYNQGLLEFQRLVNSVIGQVQSGSLTAPAATVTNATPPTPTTPDVPEHPDTTVSDTTVLTTTLSDGDQVLITGTGTLGARLRDPVFNSEVGDKLTASLKIFMNNSGRIGLGAANISTTPGQTPNVLGGSDGGDSSIQIVPDGNCFIDVNSDLLIGGSKPIIPTPNFGTSSHRITFYSAVPRTITVTTNTTWDLSDFGLTGSDYVNYGKEIVFGGMVSLVLEPGAKIRFPYVDPAHINQTVVLYFDDQAQLIFQGDPLAIGRPWIDEGIAGTDCRRNKILGMGQIWLNKNAAMIINKPALVGIEADYTTPKTDITLSLQRNAKVLIGSGNISGGALQIGNMYDGGSAAIPEDAGDDDNFPNSSINPDGDFVPHLTSIDFTLTLNGDQPLFKIGRQGFFGIAAGVINKDGAPSASSVGPNGDSDIANSAWQLQRLYNVSNVTLNITQGIFDHSLILDGNAGDCSMLAISKPASAFPHSKYIIKLGQPKKGIVRGGGNLYFVDKDASMILNSDKTVTASPHTVSLTDAAYDLSFILPNSGKYAPMAPSIATRGRNYAIPGVTSYNLYGRGIVQSTTDLPYVFAGPAEEFYYALRVSAYSDSVERYVPLAIINTIPIITYVNNNTIIRTTLPTNTLRDGTPDQTTDLGYVRGEKQMGGAPTRFSLATE
ncbi:MAG: hypothetical protein QG604_277 [Candidatus Dependentiae bacterium]|nr:hypothetical protein [Candidatus Dependentiae bacterium]